MDELHERFYEVQERLAERREKSPLLCLYDLTSSYFEGRAAEDGAYGHARDKRWDRYQIVIGLVCDEQGVPLAIEVWPGNTADSTTVTERVRHLRERFGIERAAFVGNSAMYTCQEAGARAQSQRRQPRGRAAPQALGHPPTWPGHPRGKRQDHPPRVELGPRRKRRGHQTGDPARRLLAIDRRLPP